MTEIIPLNHLASPSRGVSDSDDRSIVPSTALGGVVAIGNFDGVHLGHAALLRTARQRADQVGGPAVAVVLDPHPAAILRPESVPAKLTWIERRAELMDPLGIDALVVCHTSREFLRLTAQEFFDALVVRCLAARGMVEGPNFFFGRDRGGDIKVLGGLCEAHQMQLEIVQPTIVGDEMISSTRIRGLLASGQIREATQLLGTPYRMRGTVVPGAQRGRTIGFPTANLDQIDVVVPAPGVYGGLVEVTGQQHRAAIHIGPNPTFDDDQSVKVEVHLLDFEGDLYGQQLYVDFITAVRGVVKFDSAQQLIDQLGKDIQTIRAELDSHCSSNN